MKTILSIDLAASEKNTTGIAILRKGKMECFSLNTDGEILALVKKLKPALIGMDAPLTIPGGRKDIDDRGGPHFRECDLMLRAMKIRFFPITIGAMRALTKRGMRLKEEMGRAGAEVVEIFPGASLDVLGLKRKDVAAVNRFLKKSGCSAKNGHESDAAIGAYTLWRYSEGDALELKGRDGCIVLPGRR